MENADVFTYVPLTKPDCVDSNSVKSEEAIEAKWRVIEYILKIIILKTD